MAFNHLALLMGDYVRNRRKGDLRSKGVQKIYYLPMVTWESL